MTTVTPPRRSIKLEFPYEGGDATVWLSVPESKLCAYATWLTGHSPLPGGKARYDWLLKHGDAYLHHERDPAWRVTFPEGGCLEAFYLHGKEHRASGPAMYITCANGDVLATYYRNGKSLAPVTLIRSPDRPARPKPKKPRRTPSSRHKP